MKFTSKSIGETIKSARKALGVTQGRLALTSGTGIRFIIELEKGKPSCQLDKVLTVLNTLGIVLSLTPPPVVSNREATPKKRIRALEFE